MKLIDEVAGLAAVRHSRQRVVTAGADRMTFEQPIHVGSSSPCSASVNAAWNTSMEVGVRVEAENPRTGEMLPHQLGLPDDGRRRRRRPPDAGARRCGPTTPDELRRESRGAAAPHQPAGRARADPRPARQRGADGAARGVPAAVLRGRPAGRRVGRRRPVRRRGRARRRRARERPQPGRRHQRPDRARRDRRHPRGVRAPRLLPARRLRPVLELRAVPDVPGRDLLGAAARGVLLGHARGRRRGRLRRRLRLRRARAAAGRAHAAHAPRGAPRGAGAPFVAWAAKPDRVEY